jgi:hypothetical protein
METRRWIHAISVAQADSFLNYQPFKSIGKSMSVSKQVLLTLCAVLFCVATGCGDSRPDPRANPDFNEEAMNNPGSVKMD